MRGADAAAVTDNNIFFDCLDDSGFHCRNGIIRSIAFGVNGKVETVKPGVPVHIQITSAY
jgi:hypothetical protein